MRLSITVPPTELDGRVIDAVGRQPVVDLVGERLGVVEALGRTLDVNGRDRDPTADLPGVPVEHAVDAIERFDLRDRRPDVEGGFEEENRPAPTEHLPGGPEHEPGDENRGEGIDDGQARELHREHRDDHRDRPTGVPEEVVERALLVEAHLVAVEDTDAEEVDRQAARGDRQGRARSNGHWGREPLEGLPEDEADHRDEQDTVEEGREGFEAVEAVGEAGRVPVAGRHPGREKRHDVGQRVEEHVDGVAEQRYRAEEQTTGELHDEPAEVDHRHEGQFPVARVAAMLVAVAGGRFLAPVDALTGRPVTGRSHWPHDVAVE